MVTRISLEQVQHDCPRPPGAVLFDLDGTLVDSARVIVACYNAGLKATGHRPLSGLEVLAMLGPPLEDLYRKRIPERDVSAACDAYRETFQELYTVHIGPIPGAVDLLRQLRAAGVRTGVITNRTRHCEEILQQCGLAEHVEIVIKVSDGPYTPKPDPEMLYVAMEQLNAIPGETCFVGDSLVDMQAGLAAHTWNIGLTTLRIDPGALEAAGAHVVAGDLTVLPKVLGLVKSEPALVTVPAAAEATDTGETAIADHGALSADDAQPEPPSPIIDTAAASLTDQPVPMEAADAEPHAPVETPPTLPAGADKSDMPPEVEEGLDEQPVPMESAEAAMEQLAPSEATHPAEASAPPPPAAPDTAGLA